MITVEDQINEEELKRLGFSDLEIETHLQKKMLFLPKIKQIIESENEHPKPGLSFAKFTIEISGENLDYGISVKLGQDEGVSYDEDLQRLAHKILERIYETYAAN